MNLTSAEQLTLLMLCDIHKKLGITNSFDPELISDAIHGGHLWALKWEYPGLAEKSVPESTVREVTDILDMWDMIELSFEELGPDERARYEDDETVGAYAPKFGGFDGNNETMHMSVASFLVEKMGRWQRFAGRNMNSHVPTLDTADRQLRKFNSVRSTLGLDGLPRMTANEIVEVVRERIHPEHRVTSADGTWTISTDLRERLKKV